MPNTFADGQVDNPAELIDAIRKGIHGYPCLADCIAIGGLPNRLMAPGYDYVTFKIFKSDLLKLQRSLSILIQTEIPLEISNLAFDAIVVRLVAIFGSENRGFSSFRLPKSIKKNIEMHAFVERLRSFRSKAIAHKDVTAHKFSVGAAYGLSGNIEIFFQENYTSLGYDNNHHGIIISNAREIAAPNWRTAAQLIEFLIDDINSRIDEKYQFLLAGLKSVPHSMLPVYKIIAGVKPQIQIISY